MSTFDHEDEVIKARCMPQEMSVVASMTNTGVINVYNMPEITNMGKPSGNEV